MKRHAICACAVLLAATLVGPSARAATTFQVTVGEFVFQGRVGESMRFFPSTLRVHQGDTIHFTSASTHSIVLLPAGYSVDQWVATAVEDPAGEWTPFLPDEDEGPGALKLNPTVAFPTYFDCGLRNQPACDYDADPGLGPTGAGFPEPHPTTTVDYSVVVTAPAGTNFQVVDVLSPRMRMTVEVVGANEAADSQTAIDAEKQDLLAQDAATATALAKKYSKKVGKGTGAKRVWDVRAGVEEGSIALRGFFPKKLTIKRKQRVRFMFDKLLYSATSATFPTTRAQAIAATFPQIVCDPDGAGSAPDREPDLGSPPFCEEDPDQMELDVPTEMPNLVGNRSYKAKADFDHSGVRGAGYATSNAPYLLRFPVKSPAAGFSYASIGGAMFIGTVVVK